MLDALSQFWSLQENRDRLAETKKQLGPLREVQEGAIKHATSGSAMPSQLQEMSSPIKLQRSSRR